MEIANTFLRHFKQIEDPRMQNHNFRHNLSDILIIAILATICDADGLVEIEKFGLAKEDWLNTFLELPNGIPSHDTFGRVFSLLDPSVFQECFLSWINSLHIDLKKEIIAIDGKTLRGSGDKTNNNKALHLVSAWAANNKLMLAQVKTEEKSNEITAIPNLLKMLDIKDSVVTIDAMGCQQKIVKQICNQEANYVVSLKNNQPKLYQDVENIFSLAENSQYKKMLHLRKIEKIKDHGRIETRRYTLISARDNINFGIRWPGLQGIGKLEITRTINNKVEHSTRYFLTSLKYTDIDLFMSSVRKHWNIEINLHWSLDVSFNEDHSQVRIGHAAENLALIRRIALNLLKQEKTHKNGIKCRRKTAGWDHKYLLKVLLADSDSKSVA